MRRRSRVTKPSLVGGKAELDVIEEGREEGNLENVSIEGNVSSSSTSSEAGTTDTQRDPSKKPMEEELQRKAVITEKCGFMQRSFLFETRLTPRDVKEGKLFVPIDTGRHHFPSLPKPSGENPYMEQIKISDTQGFDWLMTLRYVPRESAYIIDSKWQEFAQSRNLKATDAVRFYRPVPRSHDYHYQIETVVGTTNQQASGENEIGSSFAEEFKPENFLFEQELSADDVTFRRILVLKEDLKRYFPSVRVPGYTSEERQLYLTDAQSKEWRLNVMFYMDEKNMIIKEWKGFIDEYRVEAGDTVRFYKPLRPLNPRHFLVELVKRSDGARTSGTAGIDGTTGGGDDEESDNGGCGGGGGDGGGSSGGSRKGMKFGFGNCCRA
ncbi:hypothetical protein U1Q18_033790 [Sarracenia purpurea var. burkii]